jgi:hypothetical protein
MIVALNQDFTKLYERIIIDGELNAEVIRNNLEVDSTQFFSNEQSSLQLGVLSHRSGYIETPHFHPKQERDSSSTQQFFIVTRGKVIVDFFSKNLDVLESIELLVGDSILLIEGIHRIRIIEDSRCVSVKQGPFLGISADKVEVR